MSRFIRFGWHSSVGCLAGFVLLFALSINDADAQVDICREHGGTADCKAPTARPWYHQVSDGYWTGAGATEAAAIEAYRQAVLNAYSQNSVPCQFTATDQSPSPPSIGVGNGYAINGTQSSGVYGDISWTLSTETTSYRAPLRLTGTYGAINGPACANQVTREAYIARWRGVECPPRYTANFSSQPNSYCWRGATTPDPFKDCGGNQCQDKKGSGPVGNPANPMNGNKSQIEQDYLGRDGLNFVRYYNNQLYTGNYTAVTAVGLGHNWRSSYDRQIRFTNAAIFPTAYAIRADGRTLHFKLANGVFNADPDIDDVLARFTDASGNTTGWQYTVAATLERESYDANGRLQAITSRRGITQTLNYDTNGRLRSVVDSFGRSLQFTYDASSRLQTLTDPNNKVFTYTPNAVGNVSKVAYPDETERTYVYNEPANVQGADRPFALTGIIDENNSRLSTYKYDGNEWVVSTEHAGGTNRYIINYYGNWTAVTDGLGAQQALAFSNIHGISRTTAASGLCGAGCASSSAATTYDSNANVTSRTDFRGNKTCYAYDTRNLETVRLEGLATGSACPVNLASYIPASGTRERKIETTWHSTYRLPVQVLESGRRTNHTHDANGNILTTTVTDLTVTPNTSRTWTYTYNAFGKVLTADGPRTDLSDITTYTYYTCATGYQCGQVQTITNALGHVTTYDTYNAHGQPLSITDSNGIVTTLTYDPRQRLTSRTVGTEQTTIDYWPTGLLKKATLPDGTYLEYTYDAAHRLTDINDADGNRIHYTLDAMGNRTNEEVRDSSSALTRTRTQVFSALSRLAQTVGAAGGANVTTTYGYDNNGNQTSSSAPLGRNTTQTYDELNRLSAVTDPESGFTQYGYDALDQLISVTDPRSLTTSYTYNGLGDLKQQVSPDTGTTTNTYDSGGNLKTSTDARSVITTYTYDELNRVKTAAFKKGTTTDQTITYTYDANANGKGRLTGAADSAHSLAWTYDDQGRVLTARQNVGSVSKTTTYVYANGQRSSMTTPSGQLVTYGYTNGQVTSVSVNGTVVISNVLYDPFGPVRQWTWGNGTLSNRTFDLDGKITQVDSAGLKTYAYDDAFRITGITDTTNAALSWAFGYDELDRLTSATKTGTTLGYTYDANGNRLTQTGTSASTYTVSTTSNRLASTSGALARTYAYDNAGNTTSFTGVTFTYNNRGRMKSSTKNSTTTNYTYNALGQMIKKGSGALYYYDEAGHVLGTYNGSGALTEEILWLGDTPIATLRPKTGGVDVFYVHSDHLNTPRVVTRPSDNKKRWRWDSEPFGVGAPNQNPEGVGAFTFNLRFPGQVYIAETGLHYNYYRDYDPQAGRYIQSDPIGLGGGLNTYAYASNAPISAVDPNGLYQLTANDAWSYSTEPPGLARTKGWLGHARCVCEGCGSSWKLNECSNALDIRVLIRPDLTADAEAFARRSEDDHVRDFYRGVPRIIKAGNAAEKILKQRTFSSQSECESESSRAVTDAVWAVRDAITEESRLKYDTGPDAPHRHPRVPSPYR